MLWGVPLGYFDGNLVVALRVLWEYFIGTLGVDWGHFVGTLGSLWRYVLDYFGRNLVSL